MSVCVGPGCKYPGCKHGGVEEPTIHPENTPEGQAAQQKERAEQEARFRQSISHLPLRKQRKMLAKYGLDGPKGGTHTPQLVLSRRERRKQARADAKATKGLFLEQDPAETPTGPSLDGLTLKELRVLAQEKNIRVDGKRPSLCSKKELLEALEG